jgi:hypothetical protein
MGLSGLFRSLCFPLGISVENPVLEIEGLESRSGLIIGDLVTIHVERMEGGKRKVLSLRRTRANLVSGRAR